MKELREWGITIVVVTVILVSVTIFVNHKATEAHERGYSEGYSQGYVVGAEGIDPDHLVRNPTYDEVQEVLAESKETTTWEINNFAEANNIRTAYVLVGIASENGSYRLVAFETIDKGLIFLCPRTHQEVKVEIGKRYSELNDLSPPDRDDTIIKIAIIW